MVAACLAATCLGAGCFTGPINMKPEVRIDPLLAPFLPGTTVTYTATARDPDGDTISLVQWNRTQAPCINRYIDDPGNWPPTGWSTGDPKNNLVLSGADTGSPFCVWAKVTDSHGAASVDVLPSGPGDQPPTVHLELVSPAESPAYPPGTQFVLTGQHSMDPDTAFSDHLRFSWTLEAGPPITGLMSCGDASMQCLVAPVPGNYAVRLRVTDDAGLFDTARMMFKVVQGPQPVARIDLVAPSASPRYALGTRFEVTAKHSTFDSTIITPQIQWQIESPATSSVNLEGCNDPDDTAAQCFVAAVPGVYIVKLVITDAGGSSVPAIAKYEVE
jgi:hypothetical protein